MKTALLLLLLAASARAGDVSDLCRDHVAVERIYYNHHHQLDDKPPFEQVSPASERPHRQPRTAIARS